MGFLNQWYLYMQCCINSNAASTSANVSLVTHYIADVFVYKAWPTAKAAYSRALMRLSSQIASQACDGS